jgi:hypothetical protein
MNQDTTTEFSICLIPDIKTTQSIINIRQSLPSSPFRDDTPHMTLLRLIRSKLPMSDNELLKDIDKLLSLSKNLPLTATARRPANGFSPLYKLSSGFLIRVSPEMKAFRKRAIRVLKQNGYSIGFIGKELFLPHITVRLGIPFTKSTKVMIKHRFEVEENITFSKWSVLKVINKDNNRLMKELSLAD